MNQDEPRGTDARKSRRAPEGGRPRRHVPVFVRALFFGLLTDIGGSICSGIVISMLYAIVAGVSGQGSDEIVNVLQSHDSALYMLSLLAGLVFSFAGGYVCARIAGRGEYRLGALQAVLSTAFGVWMSDQTDSFGIQVALAGLSILLIMLGVALGAAQNRLSRPGA